MIGIIGPEIFAGRIANALKDQNVEAFSFLPSSKPVIQLRKDLRNCDIIHFISSPTVSKQNYRNLLCSKLLWKSKIIVSWIGSDVLRATHHWFWKMITKSSNSFIDVHLTTAKNLVNELKEIGIYSFAQPIPVYSLHKVEPLPQDDVFAIYLPDQTDEMWKFYQGDLIWKLVSEFPKVNFKILSNSGKKFKQKNVMCMDWVDDIKEIYSQVKGVIRLPLHDGTSGTTLETLSMGRNMITCSTQVPFCKTVKNYFDLKQALEEILAENRLNEEGSSYVHENYNKSKLTSELIKIYNSI